MATAPSNNSLGFLLRQNLTPRMMIMNVRKKVDTDTNAIIRYEVSLEFFSSLEISFSSGTSAKLSEISKYMEQVADREGCPLSFTDTIRFCFMLSDSEMSRCVLISPLWTPILKSPGSVDFTI
uniref:Uncharacterized protein n=1 Tax=Amphiprion percula TaxID=161767 RepID=A0A3P8T510_AMPPE